MSERLSATKDYFLDMLYLFGVFLSSGYSTPPRYACDRESYERFCESAKKAERYWIEQEIKEQELLELQIHGNEVVLELTEKGVLEALKGEIRKTKENLKNGECCIVSFDIPEYIRKTRSAFRRFLKSAHFTQIQRSVWKSEYNVMEPMSELVNRLKIEKWAKVFRATEY